MRTSINITLFSSNCTTWLIDVHPIGSGENILEVLHLVRLDLQFCHMQLHVRWHVSIFHTHIHQRPLHILDACQNCVMMPAMGRNHLGDKNALISDSNYSVWWKCKLGVECPFYKIFIRWRAGCATSGISPKLLPSSPIWPLLLDKAYWTFTSTLNFEDDLAS